MANGQQESILKKPCMLGDAMLDTSDEPLRELGYSKLIRKLLADIAVLSPHSGPIELCCMWFDDLYFPGQSMSMEYAPDVWELGQREWRDCFNTRELNVLAKFHEVFASQVDALPTTSQWREDVRWLSVSTAAGAALDALEILANRPSLRFLVLEDAALTGPPHTGEKLFCDFRLEDHALSAACCRSLRPCRV